MAARIMRAMPHVGADILLSGRDESGVPNPLDLVPQVAVGEYGVGGRIGNGVVGKQLAQPLGDAFRMLLPKLGCEPALLRGPSSDGAQNNQPVDAAGVRQRQRLCDEAAQREARKVGRGETKMIPDPAHVVGEILQAARAPDGPGFAVADEVHADDLEVLLHALGHLVPRAQIGTDAMDERHVRARAIHPIVDIRFAHGFDVEFADYSPLPVNDDGAPDGIRYDRIRTASRNNSL